MKKWLSLVLVLVITCALTVTAHAANIRVDTDDDKISAGDAVTVTVTLEQDIPAEKGATMMQGELKYDGAVLEFLEIVEKSAQLSGAEKHTTKNKVLFHYLSADNAAVGFTKGTLLKIKFRAKEDLSVRHATSTMTFTACVQNAQGKDVGDLTYNSVISVDICADHMYEEGACTVCGKKSAVAQVGDVQYQTVAAALAAANSGDVVKVIGNTIETDLIVKNGVTLDLGSYTVEADYLIALNGSMITGSTMEDGNSGAKLIVPKGSVVITSGMAENLNNGWSVIPIYVDGAYTFARAMIYRPIFSKPAQGVAKVEFVPTFNNYVKQNIFHDGCKDNDVSIIIRVAYMEGDIQVTREYYYTTPMVKASMLQSKSMFAEMSGCDSLKDLTFTIAIVTGSGVRVESQTYTY